MAIDPKELTIVKTQVRTAQSAANVIVVQDDPSMLEAGELRKKIKTVGKMIEEKKKAITKPLNEALKEVRSMFAPLEQSYEEAEKTVATKMIVYQNQVEAERRKIEAEAQRKLEEAQRKLEEGEITEKQAERIEQRLEIKLEKAPEVITKSEDFHTKSIKKVRIIDATLIPREYLVPDMVKINAAVKSGVPVAGCELFEEKILV